MNIFALIFFLLQIFAVTVKPSFPRVLVLLRHPNYKRRLLTNKPKVPRKNYTKILRNFVYRLKASKLSYLSNSNGLLKFRPSQVKILSEKQIYSKTTTEKLSAPQDYYVNIAIASRDCDKNSPTSRTSEHFSSVLFYSMKTHDAI